ncbi:MAG: type 1 glutamine amidotransferase [Candidatus Xenobia bacterium]
MTHKLAERHVPYRVIEAWNHPIYPTLQQGDAVIGLGGPGTVNELDNPTYHGPLAGAAKFIRRAEQRDIPFLGICLSHQLKAKVDGHEVGSQGRTICGLQQVDLTAAGRRHWIFRGMPSHLVVYEAHHDQVMSVDGDRRATVLASSKETPVEAVAWGNNSVTVQFHPDALNHKYVDSFERKMDVKDQEGALQNAPPNYNPYLNRFFDNFLIHSGFPVSR